MKKMILFFILASSASVFSMDRKKTDKTVKAILENPKNSEGMSPNRVRDRILGTKTSRIAKPFGRRIRPTLDALYLAHKDEMYLGNRKSKQTDNKKTNQTIQHDFWFEDGDDGEIFENGAYLEPVNKKKVLKRSNSSSLLNLTKTSDIIRYKNVKKIEKKTLTNRTK